MLVKELRNKLEGMDDDGVVEIEIYPPEGGDGYWWDFEVDRGIDSGLENPEEIAQSKEEYEFYVKGGNTEHALLRLKEHR